MKGWKQYIMRYVCGALLVIDSLAQIFNETENDRYW